MSDYFDQFEQALSDAVARRAHLRWYARVRLPIRGHGLGIAIAALVLAAPAAATVGALSGWFSAGKPDPFYPVSSTSGLGRAIPGTRLLPIRVADPDGGPPWGMRLVRTSRGDTCVQVGRVEYDTLGSLGIDYSWGNDRKFHPINPNDGVADVCGATDAAGHGFVSSSRHGWPASAYTPLDYGSGTAFTYCQAGSPVARLRARLNQFPQGSKARALFVQILKRQEAVQSRVHVCPPGSLRMIFVGLLGPDAQTITYRTPSGAIRTEGTVGGVGAYLIVFKETTSNCNDFTTTLMVGGNACGDSYASNGDGSSLRGPNAVISVTYNNGKTCTDEPSPSVVAEYRALRAQFRRHRDETGKQARARLTQFLAAHHLTERSWFLAVMPQCPPVGWVAGKQPRLTPASVASPLKVSFSEGKRFCSKGPWSENSVDDNRIACDHRIPKGYQAYYESPAGANGPLFALIRVSFTARQPVTTTNSYYEWDIENPGNHGGGGNRTQADVRRGQQVIFTMTEAIPGTGAPTYENVPGIYHGTISYMQNAGQNGANGGYMPGRDGSIVVGRFSFKLPLTR